MPPDIPPSDQPTALSGIRVVSLGQVLAAPFCATLLAEFGAEVIKVERPGSGDGLRGTIAFPQENRGKQSVTCDIKSPQGKALLKRLIDTADILVENFRPGTLERLDLAPDDLRATNPGLIVVRISGYGQTGPYRERAGFDRVALSFAGITAVTGEADRPPVRPGYMIADYGAGTFAALGALLALQARQRTGRGQDVDQALYEAVWRMSGSHMSSFGRSGRNRERSGNYFPGVVPAEQFQTADGEYLILNATTDRVFGPASRRRSASRHWPTTRPTRSRPSAVSIPRSCTPSSAPGWASAPWPTVRPLSTSTACPP